MRQDEFRPIFLQAILCVSILTAVGCTPRYVYTPTIAERALATNITLDGVDANVANKRGISLVKADIQITDVDVFAFANDVKQAWRNRSQATRTLNVLTGVSRVGLAGTATAVAAASPAGAASDAVPVLTGIAASIGEIFGLVDPGGRAEAYQDGLKLLLAAEGEYLNKLPPVNKNGNKVYGKIPSDRLTEAGKTFFKRLNAAIVVVDKALQGRVPHLDDVRAATAKKSKTEEEDEADTDE